MNNIEDKIKKEFQQREIQPSSMVWDKLSEKLEAQNQEKTKSKFVYYQIAAVLIGLLVGFTFFLNKKENKINTKIEVVSSEKVETQSIKGIVSEEILKNNKNEVAFSNKEKTDNQKSKINSVKQNTLKNNSKIKKAINNKQIQIPNNLAVSIDNSANKKEESTKSNKPIKNTQIAMLSPKSEIALVTTKNTIDDKVAKKHRVLMNTSDEDIDNMLALALTKQTIKPSQISIDNKQLQFAIENELQENKNTKYKIYKVIKTGIDSVEKLLASNNNN